MVSSLWTNVFLWKILFIFILLQVALSFAFAANGSDAVVLQQHSRNRFFVGIDWLRRFVQVNLTSSFNIFGRGMFDKLYVNSVGAITFGEPYQGGTRRDAIIFVPLLQRIEPTAYLKRSISYRQVTEFEELQQIQNIFRKAIAQDFTVVQAFLATFEFSFNQTSSTKALLNKYQIILASSGDKTYVRFAYESVDFVQQGTGYAQAGIIASKEGAFQCRHEINGSGTETMANLTELTNRNEPGVFYWRVDLPLECKKFQSECGRPGEPAADFNLCPAGDFMETVTAQQWIFYKFYFCKAGRTMTNGLVSVKRECRYDSDYYTYEWSSLNDDEKCVSRIQDFWANFFSRNDASSG